MAAMVQLLGLAVLAAGLWMLAPWLGVAAAGAGLIGVGLVLELNGRTTRGPR